MSITLNLDSETEARLRRVAEARGRSPEEILREALEQYLGREEEPQRAGANGQDGQDQHPAGKPWPRRNPVGGIITPV